MKKFILFISLISLMFSANAQSGATCATAIVFPKIAPDVNYDETQTQISQWYQFTSENTEI